MNSPFKTRARYLQFLLLASVGLTFALPLPCRAGGTNLIVNGGFEQPAPLPNV